jgi:hypothetical protein
MKSYLIKEILKPILRRCGTAMGATLVGFGVAHEQAVAIETASIALLLVLADLILSHFERETKK